MIRTSDMFTSLTDAAADLANHFAGNRIANDVLGAIEECTRETNELTKKAMADRAMAVLASSPVNTYLENGTLIYEIAVPGKTKADFKISRVARNIIVTSIEQKTETTGEDASTEEKPVENKREVLQSKIKHISELTIAVEPKYDLNNIKVKVENGLMTITVPPVPEEKPVEITIE